MKSFEELGVQSELLQAIDELGYKQPMPVQEEVIPYLLGNGNDVVALAQTGTGKTAAFGLPLLQKIDVAQRVPQSLVLCPTRELCLQIAADLRDYAKYMAHLSVLPVYGGASIGEQIRHLKGGVHILVATPGRLIDLLEREVVSLATVRDVVLDEADEMLNMGFTDSINAILAQVPENRNTLLFSATMSAEIAKIAKNYLRNAKEIVIGVKNEGCRNVNHTYYMVHAKDKYLALKRIADYFPDIYGIIFCRTRMETQEIADKLIQEGYNADSLHGELSQAQRDLVMNKFRQRHLQLLVATDVAARGLDVDNLTHVIHYGLPDDTESYTHRSGRTGRAGKLGSSIAIINLREKGKLRLIDQTLSSHFQAGALPTGKEICEKQLLHMIDEIERVTVNEEEIEQFLPEVYRKLSWLDKESIIKRMVAREFNRFLDYYSKAAEIEQPQERRGRGKTDQTDTPQEKRSRKAESGYTRLFLNMGKTDNFFAAQVIDLVNRHCKGKKIEIGRIDLMQNYSFFEVAEEQTAAVLRGLRGVHVGNRKVVVEVAGEEQKPQKDQKQSKQAKPSQKDRFKNAEQPPKPEKQPKEKPSRAERGYTEKRGPKKKDDWKQFFTQERPLRGEIPDFTEEGWARRKPRKK